MQLNRIEVCRKAIEDLLVKLPYEELRSAVRTVATNLATKAWDALQGMIGSQQLAGQIIVYGSERYVGFWGGSALCTKFELILKVLRKHDMLTKENFVTYMSHAFIEKYVEQQGDTNATAEV